MIQSKIHSVLDPKTIPIILFFANTTVFHQKKHGTVRPTDFDRIPPP